MRQPQYYGNIVIVIESSAVGTILSDSSIVIPLNIVNCKMHLNQKDMFKEIVILTQNNPPDIENGCFEYDVEMKSY